MKKTFDLIKDYIFFGLILCIIVALFTPISVSAADDPTEGDQAVIPAGTYSFKLDLAPFLVDGSYAQEFIDMRYTVAPISYEGFTVSTDDVFDVFFVSLFSDDNGDIIQIYQYLNTADGEIEISAGGETISAYSLKCYPYNDTWVCSFATEHDDYEDISSLGRTITVLENSSVPSYFAEWFLNSTTIFDPVEPDPSLYTISAGYYKVRDSWNTSGFPVSNDSILIRYYDDALNVQAYEEAEGITFHVVNDIVEILYGDSSVFSDGWNIDGAKNIQVLQDISVDSGFYTVFNNIFEPSSASSNDFESGYAAGYVDGREEGYDIGYRQGYAEGSANSSGNFFADIIGGVVGALDRFTLFAGYSLLDLFTTLLGGMAFVWILKVLAGG